MRFFEMCDECNDEYNDVEKRRHYSQTNSCGDCGITMRMFDEHNEIANDNKEIIRKIVEALSSGKILAVKGIGGYLLLCDANNEQTIKLMRRRKHRPTKPFALMFPDIHALRQIAFVNKKESDALRSVAAPIVLLDAKKNIDDKICTKEIFPGLSKVGVMLPYTPLFDLILSKFNKSIIATSANISDSPIIYKDEDALRSLFNVADLVITNDREIVIPQDDSVIQFTKISVQKIIIRRSRGLAPSYFNYVSNSHKTILATGALLKSSFTFADQNNIYVSQYLGNTEGYEAQQAYKKTVEHYFQLFGQRPDIILTDRHPQYFSNQFAKKTAGDLNVNVEEIQHHKAHFAAALAENDLLRGEPVLGVIWDGTGFGDDGNIWGGEFFVYENNNIQRAAHFNYFPFILGDKMPKEPRISALATCAGISASSNLLKNKFTTTEWKLYQQMLQRSDLKCSSVGRIFDAVASLLNLSDKQSYEGEAAMLLQEQAMKYFNQHGWTMNEYYFTEDENTISTSLLMEQIINDVRENRSVEFIAAKFHYSLVQIIKNIANNFNIKKIAFSGGVFVNSVLIDLLQMNLGKDFELFFHKELSPNDENISFGQFVYYDNKLENRKDNTETKKKLNKYDAEEIINY
jgi:hydrogenase maturation protein HypF